MADETYRREDIEDDGVQHGIDDSATGDAEKGAVLGGLGGAAAGAAAGAMAGPMGALAGAAIGGVAGAVASGLAVGAVDRVDNDNTITGIGDGATSDAEDQLDTDRDYRTAGTSFDTGYNATPGVQTGGTTADGSPDTRGIMEKTADAVTGDKVDDKTGKTVGYPGASGAYGSTSPTDMPAGDLSVSDNDNLGHRRVAQDANVSPYDTSRDNYDASMDNDVPGVQTGGRNADGSADTRGIMEKTADTLTGDEYDDKTGKRV